MQVLTRPPAFALVDEADAVLVDECATPLVMSVQADVVDSGQWRVADAVAARLAAVRLSPKDAEDARARAWAEQHADATLLPHTRQAALTERGGRVAAQALGEVERLGGDAELVGRRKGGGAAECSTTRRSGGITVRSIPEPPWEVALPIRAGTCDPGSARTPRP